eukprot:GHVH01015227.1.p1 GENE.GHVH01015227.1~~GHVH01015227.1.p1  ORF type:complete len:125 (+),score=9.93 GHVH01015227.1:659-1033(+)
MPQPPPKSTPTQRPIRRIRAPSPPPVHYLSPSAHYRPSEPLPQRKKSTGLGCFQFAESVKHSLEAPNDDESVPHPYLEVARQPHSPLDSPPRYLTQGSETPRRAVDYMAIATVGAGWYLKGEIP